MARELAGLPVGDEAKAIADALSGDPEVARVIRGQRAVRALKDVEVTGPAEAREVVGELLKIEESFAGTAAAREAAGLRAWVGPWLDEEDEDEEFDEDEPVGAPAAQTSSKENAARR